MQKLKIDKIRKDFPLISNSDIVYFDNAATAQKPECVIQAEKDFYEKSNANPLRGLYSLSVDATQRYESARDTVKDFINAKSSKEIIFTRNATESLNLVAFSLTDLVVQKDDEIIVGIAEHHSNMLPWRQAAKRLGAKVKYLDCNKEGKYTLQTLSKAITDKTKIVAITQVSNVFGNENDIKKICRLCHEHNIIVVVDASQSVAHMSEDVQDLDVDFLAFSGHKMYGPMGIGVLYGKESYLREMQPFLTGGEMIDYVSLDDVTYSQLPHKFEAGTVNAGGAVGLSKAIEYINGVGMQNIHERELMLCNLALEKMKEIPHINIIGGLSAEEHNGIITFTIDNVHPHDVAAIFDSDNIAVRAGHHCAQPLMQYLNVMSTVRASIAFYNTEEEILKFIDSLSTIREKMGYGK